MKAGAVVAANTRATQSREEPCSRGAEMECVSGSCYLLVQLVLLGAYLAGLLLPFWHDEQGLWSSCDPDQLCSYSLDIVLGGGCTHHGSLSISLRSHELLRSYFYLSDVDSDDIQARFSKQ